MVLRTAGEPAVLSARNRRFLAELIVLEDDRQAGRPPR